MALYKRGEVYWVELRDVAGTRVRESTDTSDPEKARAYHDRRKKELKVSVSADVKTWDAATDRWLKERTDKATLYNDEARFKWLDQHWAGKRLIDIDDDEVKRVLLLRKADTSIRSETSITTVNHYLVLIRSLFNYANSEWKWNVTPIKLKPFKGGNKKRIRFLTEEELQRLFACLPPHLRIQAEFAVETGLRWSNHTMLRWDQVDAQNQRLWVYADDYKNGDYHGLRISDRAMEIIESQRGRDGKYVFVHHGRPVERLNAYTWATALARAGIEDFRWHDFRHCFASNHARNGTPLLVLKSLGGWKSMEMVDKYAFLAAEGQAAYANNSRVLPAKPTVGAVGNAVGKTVGTVGT